MIDVLQGMNAMWKRVLAVLLGLNFGVISMAVADDDCHVPLDRWLAPGAVVDKADERGWKIDKLKIDDGCYEIRGRDAQGRRFEAKLDPASLDVVKWKLKERRRQGTP